MALEKSAEHGYRCIEFAYLRPELLDLDRLAKRSQERDVQIGVTLDKDVSSEDPDAGKAGKAMLADAVQSGRRCRWRQAGGILYSAAHQIQYASHQRWLDESRRTIAETDEIGKVAGVDMVLKWSPLPALSRQHDRALLVVKVIAPDTRRHFTERILLTADLLMRT